MIKKISLSRLANEVLKFAKDDEKKLRKLYEFLNFVAERIIEEFIDPLTKIDIKKRKRGKKTKIEKINKRK